MSSGCLRRCLLAVLLLIGAVVFFAGINWGLPTRASDRFLFGDVPPWSGQKIMQLAGERPDDAQLGANVPTHVLDRSGMVLLNQTDEDRARIIRRYRLYSEQPDENTLLMSIGRMKPRGFDFDPHFYQYGGWFVYPVAGMLKLAGVCGYLKLTPDIAYYIDHPEQFGRFYMVARSWAAIWGLIGVWAVFWIGRRMTGNLWSAAILTLAYIFLPVVINQAHEAKPHLQAAVLTLLAVIAAFKYIETGSRRFAWLAGGLCGAAFGSVLYMIFALAVLPIMAWRRGGWEMLIIASLIAIGVYVIGNPYVAINLLRNREVLRSNLGNSTDMYAISWVGIPNAARWLMEGASIGPAVVGAFVLLICLLRFRPRQRPSSDRAILLILLAGPFILIAGQYVLLAGGKPAEYGRFAIYLDIVLVIAAWSGIEWIAEPVVRRPLALILLAITINSGGSYIYAFCHDKTRPLAAEKIQSISDHSIGLFAEPAPYCMPPIDLFRNELLLFPADPRRDPVDSPCEAFIMTTDDPNVSQPVPPQFSHYLESGHCVIEGSRIAPISWSDKPFEIYFRNPPSE